MLAEAKKYAHIKDAFMQKETLTAPTLGGGKSVPTDRKHSSRWEERVQQCSRFFWRKNKIFKDHRPKKNLPDIIMKEVLYLYSIECAMREGANKY